MQRLKTISFLLLAASSSLFSQEKGCDLGSRSMQTGARTSQGAGVGYTHGYTTLEGFFSRPHCSQGWAPFLDLRGHVFNNSKFAANAGVGARYFTKSMSWGINSYYDYRNTSEFHYNQWGLGLEAIGSFWSVNVNGYLPVGKTKSRFFNRGISGTAAGPTFGYFEGNQFFIALSGTQAVFAQREFAFEGVDAKFLMRLGEKSIVTLDGSIAPYYYHGDYGKYAVGGQAALIARVGEHVMLSASGSYDNLFHQRGQLSFGLSIPFGPRNSAIRCKTKQPCSIPSFFNDRVRRGAQRAEIIVLDKHREELASAQTGSVRVAINPSTGQPYVVWFVNNLSSSSGTFESPYKTVQDALMVAQANDIIYIYTGDGSPYDAAITLLDGQYLFGSAVGHTVQTQLGPITLPAQDVTAPTLENSMGATIITAANENTISGFTLNVLSAGDTIVANTIDSLVFSENSFSTMVTTGMNNLVFTDATGTLVVENNEFIMDPGDMGSLGVVLTDGGSGSSSLSIIGNTFTNHASTPVNLTYSGTSSPKLNIATNTFTPPSGTMGLTAVNLNTSNATVLANSTFSGNTFSSYTGNIINMTWSGSGSHALTISSNDLVSDDMVTGTNGILLSTSASGASSITVSNNTFTDQTNTGVQCIATSSAAMAVNISGNTIVGLANPGNNGIQIGAQDSSSVSGSITNNTCSEHLGGNINGFPSTSGNYSLTVANNMLTGPSTVHPGSFPTGIQFSASGSSTTMSFNIHDNTLMNHAAQGINLFGDTSVQITSIIDHNTLTVPDSWMDTSGIQVSASNTSAITSTHTITNNTCTGHWNGNIQAFPNGDSILVMTVSNNTLSGSTAMGVTSPSGVQLSTSDSAKIDATIEQNQCTNHPNRGINLFTSNMSHIIATINQNNVTTPISASATSAISTSGNNDMMGSPMSSYTITNNTCSGPNNGIIQCFVSGYVPVSNVEISNNTLTAATAGITMSSPVGIQVGASENSTIASVIVDGNSWRSPDTYDSTGTPQGISVGSSDAASLANVMISNNTLDLAFTAYSTNTGPSGISTFMNGTSSTAGLTISNNVIDFSTATYAMNTGPSGISVNGDGTGALTDITVSDNTITFAPIVSMVTGMQQGGINIGGGGSASFGTMGSPAVVSNNTITGVEGNGITLLQGSSVDGYINATGNTISLGTIMLNEIGIVTVPFAGATGTLVSTIDSNIVEGNNGGFVGIVATNQGGVCQSVTISNNTVTNVHGANPAFPTALGGGIGAALLSSGDLSILVINNALSGNSSQDNASQGVFGLHPNALGGSGTLCLQLQDNHGANGQPADNYVLYNTIMAPSALFIYQDAGGNTGTLIFDPSMADFTPGTCTLCP